MADKGSSGSGIPDKSSLGSGTSDKITHAEEKSALVPSAMPDDFLERVAAAQSGKAKPATKINAFGETISSKGEEKTEASSKPQKMTSENYMDLYKQQQESMRNKTSVADEELKKAAERSRQAAVTARASHISSQIDAWQKTLGQSPEADARTRATIATLARELSSIKKGG